ncbi:hypothetical protein C173_03994 [Paenibacillus sp. FSL R7-277]|uniref:hypothetical protein n=1 Tax=Paenibacillus sp. FSL R7-277 TaxID=1227352 RepID=UPI0003E2A56B|nr:hypothetical protein [Paenibacillus sp. FSL R7-277]ETT77648.1 hypothetical protein C173_03994 [Paenibacillus sp. FSL R7-277]
MVKGKTPGGGSEAAGCFCVVPGMGTGNTPLAGETPLRGRGPASVSFTRRMTRQLAYDAGGKELDKLHLLTGNGPMPGQQLDKQHLNEPVSPILA